MSLAIGGECLVVSNILCTISIVARFLFDAKR